MNQAQRAVSVGVFVLMVVFMAIPAAAADIVAFDAGADSLNWRPLVPFEYGLLTVGTPDGLVFRTEFKPGDRVTFSPFSQPKYRPSDGTYLWEIQLGRPSMVPPKLREASRANRGGDGDPDVEAMHRAALAKSTLIQSGAFQILGGSVVPSNLAEPEARKQSTGPKGLSRDPFSRVDWPLDDPRVQPVDQVIPDDLIVQGSLCVGLDCVNNESFGFDTIRLKENNTRIKFDDTSTSTGFPANDWQLTANDSASGGSSKFSIEDITGSKVPFTITAGASTNSIFVDSTGRVGLRTSTPVLDLHVNTSNTPAHRLEQNNSGGFTAQTWDIAGNEANFFVRDVTGGSRLPFRIRPGAPTSSLDVNASGNVGVGTASPILNLTVSGTVGTFHGISVVDSNTGGTLLDGFQFGIGTDNNMYIVNRENTSLNLWTNNTARMIITNGGNVGIGTTTPTNPLQMASGAFVSAAGVWTDASSRSLKQDIHDLTAAEAQIALDQLTPVRYTSRIDPTEKHVGFIAEDVPELVATKDRNALSPMDIVAVLTRVLQEQQKTVEAQRNTIADLAAKIKALEAAQEGPRATTHRQ